MAFSPETYALCQKNTSEQIGEALTSVYSYKGAVDTLDDLPLYGNKIGDIYDVRSEGGQNYGWDGEKWDSLGLNREATENDLGLIRTKDNTFNNTTFIGDLTAINSEKTSITGNGITSINGDGNFEVSKPLTVIASTTTNISGDTINFSPISKINLTSNGINLTANNKNGLGITITTDENPLILSGKIIINGEEATYINTPVIGNNSITAQHLKATDRITTEELVANSFISSADNIYGKNYGSLMAEVSPLITTTGAKNNIVLGSGNNYLTTPPFTVQNIENIIIGKNNKISITSTDNFIIGQNNAIFTDYSTALGEGNSINGSKPYNFVKGQQNRIEGQGNTIFGAKNWGSAVEFGLVSGVKNVLNGKASAVLGDNLSGLTATGSLTVGTYNKGDTGNLFEIGNGYEVSGSQKVRQNAMSVSQEGVIETPYATIKKYKLILKNPGSGDQGVGLYLDRYESSNEYDPVLIRNKDTLKLGSSYLFSGGIYIGAMPGDANDANRVLNGGVNLEALSGGIKLFSRGNIDLNSSDVKIEGSGCLSISPLKKLVGSNFYTMCGLDTSYNGLYVGRGYGTGARFPSSGGTIIYLGDNLNYVNGATSTEQFNYNGRLIIGNNNNKTTPTRDNLFIVGNGYQAGDTTNGSNALRLTDDGTLYYKTGMGAGADYAEFFEWSDGNLLNEDRCGLFVTFDFNKEYEYANSQELPHIKPANEGDYILGVISGNPSFVGNSDEEWKKRWLYDDFDRPIMEAIQVPITELQEVETGEYRTEIEYDENDNEIEVQIPILRTEEVETGESRTEFVQVQNPDYNPSETYISRNNRKEWETTGMLGVLSVRDDGTCQVGKFCKCGQNGVATLAEKRGIDTFLVLKRVNNNVIKIIFK